MLRCDLEYKPELINFLQQLRRMIDENIPLSKWADGEAGLVGAAFQCIIAGLQYVLETELLL